MFGALANLAVGIFREKKRFKQRWEWFRLIASVAVTSYVAFWGTWGAVGGGLLAEGSDPLTALFAGFFAAALAMSAAVVALWKRSALTKDIPLVSILKVDEKVLEGGFSYTESAKEKKG